jgi:hypothetical protein
LRRGSLAGELLDRLRREFGRASPAAWSVSLAAQPQASSAEALIDEETLLGDYLRLVRHQMHAEQPLELAGCLEGVTAEIPATIWRLEEPAARQRVLREAAALGMQLLQGEDA